MNVGLKLTGLLAAGLLCVPIAGQADTQTPHRVHKVKKQLPPALPPLPSGPQGPVPQIPLDAIPAVAPEVSYQNGLLTIVAPNSTLADILRGVRKHTAADIEIPHEFKPSHLAADTFSRARALAAQEIFHAF